MNSGSQIDLARGNEFKSGSSYSLYSNAASKSYNDLSRQPRQSQHQQAPQKTYASDISNRLPGIVFSGKFISTFPILFFFYNLFLFRPEL